LSESLLLVHVFCVAPHVPDPFQTLADIYEAKGNTDKRMQVYFHELFDIHDCFWFCKSANLSLTGLYFTCVWCI